MIVEICQSKRGFIMDGLIGGMLAGASGATCNVKFRVKYSKEDCFNSLKQALESIKGIKIFFENQEIGTISAKKKLSMFSYGENIKVTVSPKETENEIYIEATPKVYSLVAKTATTKLINKIAEVFMQKIQGCSTMPQQSKETSVEEDNEDMKRLAKLKQMLDMELITPEEYASKKEDIIKNI